MGKSLPVPPIQPLLPYSFCAYLMSKSCTSFIAAIAGVSHMSLVVTMPPPCSSVFPCSRTVIVMITWRVLKPLMVFFSPVSFTLKSTSTCS